MSDIENRPIEQSNADIINEVCLPIIPLFMLRFEQIVNFITEEPIHIRVKLKEDGYFHDFEQVLRLRTWVPNQEANSWCIYSEVREWVREEENIGGLIIRNSVWDRHIDLQKIKNAQPDDRDELLTAWPTMRLKTFYFNEENLLDLVQNLQVFDSALKNGIKLTKRKKTTEWPEWGNINCMRRFDWGQVEATWSPDMTSKEIESLRTSLIQQLEKYLENIPDKVHQIQLDYSIPLDIWKSMTIGQ